MAVQSDRKILIGGRFGGVNGVPSGNVARLWSSAPVVFTEPHTVAGTFLFGIMGPSGREIVVERSGNLLDWQPVRTNTLGTTPLLFGEPITPGLDYFYRARLR